MKDTPIVEMVDHTPLMQEAVELEIPQEEAIISLLDSWCISSPQTLKLQGYIKNYKVVVLVDSGSTHNFIHKKVIEGTHCYVHPMSNFQIMIANGGPIKCGGGCENVKLQLGEYHLKTHMFVIDTGGCDIVLGVEWLCTLGTVTMDFKELYLTFTQNYHTHTLKDL